jgi:hypothetical protein
MKRLLLSALILAFVLPCGFAQTGDARAQGMAGAMTAVNDDMNTLFYNPAGLAFLRKSYFNIEANADATLGMGVMGTNSLPDVYSSYDWYTNGTSYMEWDSFTSTNRNFDFDTFYSNDLAFKGYADNEALSAYSGSAWAGLTTEQKFQIYKRYYNARGAYDGLSAIKPIVVSPRLVVGGPHWGAALTGDFVANSNLGDFQGYDTTLSYTVDRRLGAIAGLGFAFGPLALGASAKYYSTSSYSVSSYSFSDAVDGPPSSAFFSELFSGTDDVASTGVFEVGAGLILTLGTLNAAIYNDNILPFLNKDEYASYDGNFGKALLATTNFGLSWMPSDNKFKKSAGPLVLITSLDLRNFGDDLNRQLCAGIETGLDMGGFIVFLAHLGYTQNLPGSLSTMAESFNIDQGYVTLGATTRFWFAKIDVAATFPMTVLKNMDLVTSNSSPYTATDQFMKLNITTSLAF